MPGAYPLSPMQSGMLYQSLLADGTAERAGYDLEQVHVLLREQLDPAVFASAWNEVARRHEVLSCCIQWMGVERPVQVPRHNVSVPFELLDWRASDLARQRRAYLASDRNRGFDLTCAPLMRVMVALTSDGRSELVWSFHHILMDGRSYPRILGEVFTCYADLIAGRAVPPARDPRVYADYVEWLANHDHRPSLAYFKALLAGKREPTPLPLALPGALALTESGHGELRLAVSHDSHQGLREMALRHGTTVGGLLQAAWALLLSRLTGDRDVLFGTVRTCRYSALDGAAESMVGLLINTLPARVRIDEQATVGDLLAAMRAQWQEQKAHNLTPLIDVLGQSECAPGVPLFESVLIYDNREINEVLREQDASWATRRCEIHEQPSTPLALVASDGVALKLRLLYDRRRLSNASAGQLGRHLVTLLENFPHAMRVGDVEVLTPVQANAIVHGQNSTSWPVAGNRLIHELFEAQVDLRGTATACEADGQHHSYADIEARANRLAHALRARGVGPGSFVGVCLGRGAGLVAALLGIAKSGAAYVPLDEDYPPGRMTFMLSDAAVAVLVTEARFAGLWPGEVLLHDSAEVANASPERPVRVAAASDVCYAIYTSGSTGNPKGVVMTHHAVVNTLDWVSRTFEVGPADRALFVTSPGFDLSVYDVFGALGAGATLVVASSICLQEPRLLLRHLLENRISIWNSAPAALQRLAALFPRQVSNDLRLVLLSGDWISVGLPDLIRSTFPLARVISLGGATEAAIWSNWYAVKAVDPHWHSIPYGRPIQNTQYYVLDGRLKPVPTNVAGDLYISGVNLAKGYLNRPELTAERFVANPFLSGARMYATGDRARYLPDGELELLGRADLQVKIRGYRIELGEIEATLLTVTGIREAVCSVLTDASGAQVLVAYLTLGGLGAPETALIQEQLRKTLPAYMVPSRFVILAELPLSVSGKVERKALPTEFDEPVNTERVLPRSDAEVRMAKIWKYLLKSRDIGVTDNFFALGGDSLLAVALVVEIQREFAIEMPLAHILEHPTLGELTASLHSRVDRGHHLSTLNPGGSGPPFILFCGSGGFGFIYNELARWLGKSQVVHVIHAVGADNDEERVDHSIGELAAIYMPQIVAAFPTGPLFIGGYSFGALVAYEVASRFELAGRKVELLVSFDGLAPGHPFRQPFKAQLARHIGLWRGLDTAGRRDYLKARLTNLRNRFWKAKAQPEPWVDRLDADLQKRLDKVRAGVWGSRNKYKPQRQLRCDFLLLKAESPPDWPGWQTDTFYGWGSYVAGPINTVTVPGTHLELFTSQNCSVMAQTLIGLRDQHLALRG
jgi:amino acid adenylation domain-containing protein